MCLLIIIRTKQLLISPCTFIVKDTEINANKPRLKSLRINNINPVPRVTSYTVKWAVILTAALTWDINCIICQDILYQPVTLIRISRTIHYCRIYFFHISFCAWQVQNLLSRFPPDVLLDSMHVRGCRLSHCWHTMTQRWHSESREKRTLNATLSCFPTDLILEWIFPWQTGYCFNFTMIIVRLIILHSDWPEAGLIFRYIPYS